MWIAIWVIIGLTVFWGAVRVWAVLASAPADLGVTDGQLAACPQSPNCVNSQAQPDSHGIDPLRADDLDAMWQRLLDDLGNRPRVRVHTRSDDYLHATFQSLVFGFVDDVEFQRDTAAGVIHVRSASRLGYSDMGANRRRIEDIRAAISR